MATADPPSRMEILVLSTIARTPMHGYDIKTELRYKHVRWWARCEHGHLYATLSRLEKAALIEATTAPDTRKKKVFALTAAGRARLRDAMVALGQADDATYFDIDLFISASYTLSKQEVLDVLSQRAERIGRQLVEAEALRAAMAGRVPRAAELIMQHRIDHLGREHAFTHHAHTELAAVEPWGPFLGTEPIRAFVARSAVPLERD